MRGDLNRDKREEEIPQRAIPQGLMPNTHFVAFAAWLKYALVAKQRVR
jgi:hypothetical protein